MVIRQRQPPLCLEPRQVLGEPGRAPCEAPVTLTLCLVVPLDKIGVDGPADRRVGQTCCHRFWGSEDHPCAPLHHASALAPFDDLGIPQTGRWSPLRFGIGAPDEAGGTMLRRCDSGTPLDAARYRPYPCPRGRCAQLRAVHCLPLVRALRSQKSPDRPPARHTLCRNARPHALLTLYTTPVAAHGWGRSSPNTLAQKASRNRDSGGEDSTGCPNPWLGSLVLQRVCTRRHYKLKMSLIHHSS
jgi:hypothetical protein